MSKSDVVEIEGTVVEKLPNAMFQQKEELSGVINNRLQRLYFVASDSNKGTVIINKTI